MSSLNSVSTVSNSSTLLLSSTVGNTKSSTTEPSKKPVVNACGKLNDQLAAIPNLKPGSKTKQRVTRKLKQVIPLGNNTEIEFHQLLNKILNKPKYKPVEELLLIGSGAIDAIDPEERNNHFNESGAGELLTHEFIKRLEKKPLDTDWRLALSKEDASWKDIQEYVRFVLITLAQEACIQDVHKYTDEELAKALNIFLDRSEGFYYVLRFNKANIDLAIGKFAVHCLFDDTNAQISITPSSITEDISTLDLSIKTEEGINLLQALTYRGKGIISARNPYEKDYRAIIHVIHRIMEGEVCHSKHEISIYIKTFLTQFSENWSYHAAKKINNIFQGHHKDATQGIAWAILLFEVLLQQYCPEEERSKCDYVSLRNIWVESTSLQGKNTQYYIEIPVVKMRLHYGISTEITQSVVGIASYLNATEEMQMFGDTYMRCNVPYTDHTGFHNIIVPAGVAKSLDKVDHFLNRVSHNSQHPQILLIFFTACFYADANYENKPSQIQFNDLQKYIDKWTLSTKSFEFIIQSLMLGIKSKNGCKHSQEILFGFTIPYLLSSNSREFTAYGNFLALQLYTLAPSTKNELDGLIANGGWSNKSWFNLLAKTGVNSCCAIAVKHWIVNHPLNSANLPDYVEFLSNLWKGSPIQAMVLLRNILDLDNELDPHDYEKFLKICLRELPSHMSKMDVIAKLDLLAEIAIRSLSQNIGSHLLLTLQDIFQKYRQDLLPLCYHWTTHLNLNEQPLKGFALAYDLARIANTDEDRSNLTQFIRGLLTLPGVSDLLLSSVLFRSLKGTHHLKELWAAAIEETSIPFNKKLPIAIRWFEVTSNDTFDDGHPLSNAIGPVFNGCLALSPLPFPSLQRLLFTLWKHPLFANDNNRSRIIPLFIALMKKALNHPELAVADLAKMAVDSAFLKIYYAQKSDARSLFPLLQALVYRHDNAWETALALAEELRTDQMIPVDSWSQLLEKLSLILHSHRPVPHLHRLAKIAEARKELDHLSIEHKLEAFAIETAQNKSEAHETLRTLLCQSDKLNKAQKELVTDLIADRLIPRSKFDSVPYWLAEQTLHDGLGAISWLKCVKSYLNHIHKDPLLIKQVIQFFTNSEKTHVDPLAVEMAQLCLRIPLLLEEFSDGKEKLRLVNKLEPYVTQDLQMSFTVHLAIAIVSLYNQKSYVECIDAIIKMSQKAAVPPKMISLICALAVNKEVPPGSLLRLLGTFSSHISQNDWTKIWDNAAGIGKNNPEYVNSLFAIWHSLAPKIETAPDSLQVKVFFILCKLKLPTVERYLSNPKMIESMLTHADVPLQDKISGFYAICEMITTPEYPISEEMLLECWEILDNMIDDTEDIALFTGMFLRKAILMNAHSTLDKILPIYCEILGVIDDFEDLLLENVEQIVATLPLWKKLDQTFLPDLLTILGDFVEIFFDMPDQLIPILDHLLELELTDSFLDKQIEVMAYGTLYLISTGCSKNKFSQLYKKKDGKLIKMILQCHAQGIIGAEGVTAHECTKIFDILTQDKYIGKTEAAHLIQSIIHNFLNVDFKRFPHIYLLGIQTFSMNYSTIQGESKIVQKLLPLILNALCTVLHKCGNRKAFTDETNKIFNQALIADSSGIAIPWYSLTNSKTQISANPVLGNLQLLFNKANPRDRENQYRLFLQFFKMLLEVPLDNLDVHLAVAEHLYIFANVLLEDGKKKTDKELLPLLEKYLLSKDTVDSANVQTKDLKKKFFIKLAATSLFNRNTKELYDLHLFGVMPASNSGASLELLNSLLSIYHAKAPWNLGSFMETLIKDKSIIGPLFTEHKIELFKRIFETISHEPSLNKTALNSLKVLFLLISIHINADEVLTDEFKHELSIINLSVLDFLHKYVRENRFETAYFNTHLSLVTSLATTAMNLQISLKLFHQQNANSVKNELHWLSYAKFTDRLLHISHEFVDHLPLHAMVLIDNFSDHFLLAPHEDIYPGITLDKKQALAFSFIQMLLGCSSLQKKAIEACGKWISEYPELLGDPWYFYVALPTNLHGLVPKIFVGHSFPFLPSLLAATDTRQAHTMFIHTVRLFGYAQKSNPEMQKELDFIEVLNGHIHKLINGNSYEAASEILSEAAANGCLSQERTKSHALILDVLEKPKNTSKLFKVACENGLMHTGPYNERKARIIIEHMKAMLPNDHMQFTNSNVQSFIIGFLSSCFNNDSFENTKWALPLISLLKSNEIELFIDMTFDRLHKANQPSLMLEFAIHPYISKELRLKHLSIVSNTLNSLLINTEYFNEKENLEALFGLLRTGFAPFLSKNQGAKFALEIAKLIRTLPISKAKKCHENYSLLIDLFLDTLSNLTPTSLKKDELSICHNLRGRIAALLMSIHGQDYGSALNWAEKYYKAWDKLSHPEIGACLFLKYAAQNGKFSSSLESQLNVNNLISCCQHASKSLSIDTFHDMRFIFDSYSSLINVSKKNVVRGVLKIIKNLLVAKSNWSISFLKDIIDGVENKSITAKTLNTPTIRIFIQTLCETAQFIHAQDFLNACKKNNIPVDVHEGEIFAKALDAEYYLDALKILSESKELQDAIVSSEVVLFLTKVCKQKLDPSAVEMIYTLLLRKVKTFEAIPIINSVIVIDRVSFKSTVKARFTFYLLLQQIPYPEQAEQAVQLSEAWRTFLIQYRQNEDKFSLNHLLNQSNHQIIERHLPSQEHKDIFNGLLYSQASQSANLSAPQVNFLLQVRNQIRNIEDLATLNLHFAACDEAIAKQILKLKNPDLVHKYINTHASAPSKLKVIHDYFAVNCVRLEDGKDDVEIEKINQLLTYFQQSSGPKSLLKLIPLLASSHSTKICVCAFQFLQHSLEKTSSLKPADLKTFKQDFFFHIRNFFNQNSKLTSIEKTSLIIPLLKSKLFGEVNFDNNDIQDFWIDVLKATYKHACLEGRSIDSLRAAFAETKNYVKHIPNAKCALLEFTNGMAESLMTHLLLSGDEKSLLLTTEITNVITFLKSKSNNLKVQARASISFENPTFSVPLVILENIKHQNVTKATISNRKKAFLACLHYFKQMIVKTPANLKKGYSTYLSKILFNDAAMTSNLFDWYKQAVESVLGADNIRSIMADSLDCHLLYLLTAKNGMEDIKKLTIERKIATLNSLREILLDCPSIFKINLLVDIVSNYLKLPNISENVLKTDSPITYTIISCLLEKLKIVIQDETDIQPIIKTLNNLSSLATQWIKNPSEDNNNITQELLSFLNYISFISPGKEISVSEAVYQCSYVSMMKILNLQIKNQLQSVDIYLQNLADINKILMKYMQKTPSNILLHETYLDEVLEAVLVIKTKLPQGENEQHHPLSELLNKLIQSVCKISNKHTDLIHSKLQKPGIMQCLIND